MLRNALLVVTLAALVGAVPVQEQAAAIGPADTEVLCVLSEVIECWPDGLCFNGKPEEVEMPRFVRADLEAQTVSSPSPGFEGEAAPITAFQREDERIAMSGLGRFGRTWSIILNESTGDMNGAVLAGGYSFLIFGTCIADR